MNSVHSVLINNSSTRDKEDGNLLDTENFVIIENGNSDYNSQKDDEDHHTFPLFRNDKNLLNHKRINLSKGDTVTNLFIFILYMGSFATRANLRNIESASVYFVGAISLSIIVAFAFSLSAITSYCHTTFDERCENIYYLYAMKYWNSNFKKNVENLIPITLSIATGLFLYARVNEGALIVFFLLLLYFLFFYI